MKALVLVIGLIVAITAGLLLWSRTRSRAVVHELTLSPGTPASRTLEIGLDAPLVELRSVLFDQINRQLPEKLPSVRGEILTATLGIRIERRSWRFWASRSEATVLSPFELVYDPGPPEIWLAAGAGPLPRERALDAFIDHLLQQIEMNRSLLPPTP